MRLCIATGLFLALLAASAVASGLTDTLDASSAASVYSHAIGVPVRKDVGDFVGGHDTRRTAFVVGRGGSLSFRMRVEKGRPVTLEFEEMYGRDTLVRGYSVLVDGRPTYFRTFRGCGAGPVHFFVRSPPTRNSRIVVSLLNRADAPFAISRVWAFSDFPAYFAANRLAVPYTIAPLVGPTFRDRAKDLAEVLSIKRSLAGCQNARPGFTVAIGYAAFGPEEVRRRIEYVLALAQRSGLPVQLVLDTWWAQTPGGMDGAGGFWGDVRYIQVVYNATRKRYQLSVPNQWSSTPWYTVRSARLNAYKRHRLLEATGYLRQALTRPETAGPLLAVNLDNEPVYWASGNAGLGEDLLQADFNPAAVAAARRDGVTLDPTDGLSFTERRWLFRSLARYNGLIADAAFTGLGRQSMPAPAVAGTDLMRNNVYTQAMVGAPDLQYPMLSAAFPFWETAAPFRARAGGEWNSDTIVEREAILHQVALGRNAAVNAECGNDPGNMQSVRPGYALGQRYVTLYNYPASKMDVASAGIRDVTKPFPAFLYQPVVREERFTDASWRQRAVEYAGLKTGIIGNTAAVAIWPASTLRPGVITWALRSPRGPWRSLFLELDGRAVNYGKTDPAVNIRVLAGPTRDPGTMREVRRFHDGSLTPADRVDLTPIAGGRGTVYVRLEFSAPTIPPSVLSWCSIWKARFTTGWPADALKGMPQDESLATVRKQSLLVSWRADAEAVLAELKANRLSVRAARLAYDHGAYAEACTLANRALMIARESTPPPRPAPPPTRYEGAFAGMADRPDAFLLNGVEGLQTVRATAATAIRRNGKRCGLRDFQWGDGVTFTAAADGRARTVEASGETVEGTVEAFGQVTPFAMPYISLESGRRVVITMDARIHTPGVDGPIRSIPLGGVDIKAGDRVRIRLGALGRAFEVWRLSR